jgi:hypothetical protein
MAQPARANRKWLWVVGGCVLLLGCAVLVAVAAGVLVYLNRRGAVAEPAVAYILDTSPRMGEEAEEGTRLTVAQGVMAEVIRPASPDTTAGLRVFGSGAIPEPCEDTQLVVPFATANQPVIASELLGLTVGLQGDSSLARAMIEAVRDLAGTRGPHSLVVVTGGSDSCDPLAGELVAQEAERAGIRLQTYVVGYRVPAEDSEALKGIAEGSPSGTYYPAPDAAALRSILDTVQQRIDNPEVETGETACDHPYFPLRAGATWTYSSSIPEMGSFSWTVTDVTGGPDAALATIVMDFGAGSMSFEWQCSSEGIQYFTLGGISFDTGGLGSFHVTSEGGAGLLPPEAFEPGATWSNDYTTTFRVGVGDFGVNYESHVSETLTAGEAETVTVPAGTFEAVPVQINNTTTSSGDFGTFTTSSSSTVWFAEGVGIVRMVTTAEGASFESQLASFSVP